MTSVRMSMAVLAGADEACRGLSTAVETNPVSYAMCFQVQTLSSEIG
jgi:hypothetical protein